MASKMVKVGVMEGKKDGTQGGEGQLPRAGLVTDVCREWLVHEDGALAYQLQNEEIKDHYTGNRFRNAVLREDIPCAKEEQIREAEEAAQLQAMYDRMLAEQEEQDAEVARRLALELEDEERQRRERRELRDQEVAKEMAKREREKVAKRRAFREAREVERQARSLAEQEVGVYEETLTQAMRDTRVDAGPLLGAAAEDEDLSDFCIKPAPGMDLVEVRRLQEEQDAELARLLQEQESKRRGDVLNRDRLMAIEAQDRELARMLQEQERAKARRAKERARLKQQMRQETQQEEAPSPPGNEEPPRRPTDLDLTKRSVRSRQPHPDPDSIEELPPPLETPSAIPNIAMVIDPTYSRRHHPHHHQRPPLDTAFEQPQASPEPGSEVTSPAYSLPPPELYLEDGEEEDDAPVPPYMPIQGQRRMSTTPEKKSKPKKGKDGCKTQ